jgi:excisionase family DNA binding protein
MAERNDDRFLTTEEALEYLQINLRTVYRLIHKGQIPAVRVGRQWRFRKRDIDSWLERRSVGDGRGALHERARVLVVDDELPVRELLNKTLTMSNYDVDTAADGSAALERLRDSEYDLLITDLKMPGLDGLSVIREVRRERPEIPVIIITSYSTEANAIEAINLGVAGYITKPFRLPRILAAAARALGEPVPGLGPDIQN